LELIEAVHRFRNALVSTIETESYKIFKLNGWNELNSFPYGSCAITSNLLGKFLQNQGYNVKILYCNGVFDELDGVKSHVWLEVDDYYIDLTGYQFPFTNQRISFEKRTEPTWLKEYFTLCNADSGASVQDVDLSDFSGSRYELYEFIAARAVAGIRPLD
jgi:hypothetical protein